MSDPRVVDIKKALKGTGLTHVLLDMDGTLLDKYFDDYFWGQLVPEKYAEKHRMTFAEAYAELNEKYKAQEETLNWTDVDYWSEELDLDIIALKEQIRHLIEIHPHVKSFLREMRSKGKQIYIVTNAHDKVLDIKLKKTELGKYLDGAVTSAELGYPKEDLRFWEAAQRKLGFDNKGALFVDDTLEVLKTASRFGLSLLVHKARATSKTEPVSTDEFVSIHDFDELLGD